MENCEEKQASTVPRRAVYDFELCADMEELKQTILKINRYGYELITVVLDPQTAFIVFFRRRL